MLGLEKKDLEKLSKKDKVVNKYMENLNKLNSDPEFRQYMSYEEDQRKIKNSLISEGFEQGIEQAKKETALNMLKENININIISKCTGLSLEQLDELKEN